MTSLRFVLTPACLAVGLCIASLGAQAQTTKAPKVQLWMDLGSLGVLGLGAQAGNAQASGQAGGGQVAQRGCHQVCSRRYMDHPANHHGPQSSVVAAL